MSTAAAHQSPGGGPRGAAGATAGVHVENLHLHAWTDRFSVRQVQDELQMHGAV
jgi:hypothetical protein